MTHNDGLGGTDSQGDLEPNDADARPLVSPQAEAQVRGLLATLPPETMPDDVRQRLHSALHAEPNPYATNVTALRARHRRGRWLAAGAGIAAVGVLGVVVGSTALTDTSNPALSASVVPMSESGTVYQKGAVAAQVSASMAKWKSSNPVQDVAPGTTSTTVPSIPAVSPSIVTTSDPAATTDPTPDVTSSVSDSMNAKITQCIQRVDTRPAMYVDVGAYRESAVKTSAPVAVAVVRGDGSVLDVYVLDVDCFGSIDDFLHEHVTVVAPN